MKSDDFLTRRAFAPGEFERRQAQYDRQVLWLANLLETAMQACLQQHAPSFAETFREFALSMPGLGNPTQAEMADILQEGSRDEAFLLAGQALHHWNWFEQEVPYESRTERARRAASDALRQQDFDPLEDRDLYAALVAALETGIPAHLRDLSDNG